MGRVIIDMSPSVDGYVAGKGVSVEQPFGDAGHRLHRWLGFEGTEPTDADRAAAARMFEGAGAVVIGRRMFDVGIERWGEDGAFGLPCFVVTHRPAAKLVRGSTRFEFIEEGTVKAVQMARGVAGDGNVVVAGGANVAQQCLAAGLVDEFRLHVVPILLGEGTRLFDVLLPRADLEVKEIVTSANAVHLELAVRGRTAHGG